MRSALRASYVYDAQNAEREDAHHNRKSFDAQKIPENKQEKSFPKMFTHYMLFVISRNQVIVNNATKLKKSISSRDELRLSEGREINFSVQSSIFVE